MIHQFGGFTVTYVLFFLEALWHTLGIIVVCGLCVTLCRRTFIAMMGGGFGRGVVLTTAMLGTPVHELGHAGMCLLFGHRITAMALWQPSAPGGQLGYVTHVYRPKNLYHILGNLFIGIGPIFSGLAVLTLTLRLGFPNTFHQYMTASSAMASAEENFATLFVEGLKMLPRMVEELIYGTDVPLWGRIIALVVILAVSQHISLSPEDIKNSLKAFPLYLAILLVLTAVCGLIGTMAMDTVMGGLSVFSAYLTALFVIVLVSALIQLLVALPVWCLRMLFGRG